MLPPCCGPQKTDCCSRYQNITRIPPPICRPPACVSILRFTPDSEPGSSVTLAREYRVTVPTPKCAASDQVTSALTLKPSAVCLPVVMSAWSNLSDVNPGNVSN